MKLLGGVADLIVSIAVVVWAVWYGIYAVNWYSMLADIYDFATSYYHILNFAVVFACVWTALNTVLFLMLPQSGKVLDFLIENVKSALVINVLVSLCVCLLLFKFSDLDSFLQSVLFRPNW